MKTTVFIFVLCSLVMLTSCEQQAHKVEDSSNKKIFHKIDPDQPQVEQEILVTFEAPEAYQLQMGRVEGVNMYMGHMPVSVVQVSATTWQAKFQVGACTEPSMRWRVSIPWQAVDGSEQGVYQFEFNTETN
ncbi:hypothetical protein EGC76_03065 [Pseudidiomarina gelatinasegens]|uniref:Uncharacterized protein n=1 Tax=Pseudidiomarina gelatinasegens TaxID=2487740 RepID=A0A443Z5W7_9GAMM|nr:hypothetical protein [Pseudidiomarina gelatinasegens]RWU12181.1 hypothetical protein EGC76_03065 [Pseudidiomarina gelatinasegens]|tara:strand:- start:1218 stop:1610 length:393 start_codon:yes stop_codon:yes gene_type:complete